MEERHCKGCGATLLGGTDICGYCGTNWTAPPILGPVPLRQHVHANRAIIYGCIGLFLTPVWFYCAGFSVAGMYFGIAAVKAIRKNPTVWKGEGAAIIAIVISVISLITPTVYGLFLLMAYLNRTFLW